MHSINHNCIRPTLVVSWNCASEVWRKETVASRGWRHLLLTDGDNREPLQSLSHRMEAHWLTHHLTLEVQVQHMKLKTSWYLNNIGFLACPGVKTLGGQLFNKESEDCSYEAYLCLTGRTLESTMVTRGKKENPWTKAEKTISHKTTSQQQLVSSLLSELRCIRFVNTIVQSKFDEEWNKSQKIRATSRY